MDRIKPRNEWSAQEQDTFPEGWKIVVKPKKGRDGQSMGTYKTFVQPGTGKVFHSFATAVNSIGIGDSGLLKGPASGKGTSRSTRGLGSSRGLGFTRKGASGKTASKSALKTLPEKPVGKLASKSTLKAPPEKPVGPKYVGIAKDPSLYAPKDLGPKKKFPTTYVNTLLPCIKVIQPTSPPTYTYEFDRKSSEGRFAIAKAQAKAKEQSSSSSPTPAWDPNSREGIHVGSRIWVIDEHKTKEALLAKKGGKEKKPHMAAVWDEGRIVGFDGREYTVHFFELNDDGTVPVDKVDCKTVPYLVANNVVWSRFAKQPWWPCLTVLPSVAALSRNLVPPNQASGARMRLHYFFTNERGEAPKSPELVTQFEATVWPKRDDFHGDGSQIRSDLPALENPVNSFHLLAPDPNKLSKGGGSKSSARSTSNKYLQAIPFACEEIEERRRVRDEAIKAMGEEGIKMLKNTSKGERKMCDSCSNPAPLLGVRTVSLTKLQNRHDSLDVDENRSVNLCRKCEGLFKKGKYCNVCLKTCDDSRFLLEQGDLNNSEDPHGYQMEIEEEFDIKPKKKTKKSNLNPPSALPCPSSSWGTDAISMLECQQCGAYVHASCCNITISDFDLMKQGKHRFLNKSFFCSSCSKKKALSIIQKLRKFDTLFIFHLPVTDAVAPNYRDVVKEPMDLQTMEKRAKEGKDKNLIWVRECFEQIVLNALIFNADLGKIWLEAKKFHGKCLKMVFEGQGLDKDTLPIAGMCTPSKYHEKIIANYNAAHRKAMKERERVVVDNETKKKDLVAGHIETIEILPLVKAPTVDTCIPRAMIALTQNEAVSNSWMDCCFVCGSSGANDMMMFCVDCGEAFHSFCSGAPIECMDHVSIASWRCSNCKVCDLTGMATKNELSLLYCECCDRSVSMELLQPPLDKAPEGSWVCGLCVQCDECGATDLPKNQWSCDARLCFRCGGAKEMSDSVGNVKLSCSVCKQYTIEGLDKHNAFHFCTICDRICHKECIASIQRSYDSLGPPYKGRKITASNYECLECALESKRGKGWDKKAAAVRKSGLVSTQTKTAKELSEIKARNKQWETMELKREQYLRLIEDASELLYLIDKDVMEVKDDARRNYVQMRKKVLAEEADTLRRKRDRGDRGDRGSHSIPSASHMKRLEEIRLALVKSNNSFLFRRPVDKKAYPAYYQMIERPIDLNTIGKFVQKRKYGTAKDFLDDIDLMYRNSCQFNSAENPISLAALALLNLAKKMIQQSAADFAEWESQMVPVLAPIKKGPSPVKPIAYPINDGRTVMPTVPTGATTAASAVATTKGPTEEEIALPPSKLMAEPCLYGAVFNSLQFKRSAGFTVTETQEQRSARFARMKKRKRSITDLDELHEVEGKTNFHISSIANEAKLAASFINVNITSPAIAEETRAKIFKSVSDMKGLLAPTDVDSGVSKVAWSGKEMDLSKKSEDDTNVAAPMEIEDINDESITKNAKGASDVFDLTFAFRSNDDQLGLCFQNGTYSDGSGNERQAVFVSDIKQDGQATELAAQKGKDFVVYRTRVVNYSHTGALKNKLRSIKAGGGGLISLHFITGEPMVARVFGEGSIGGVGSLLSVPLKKRKPEQHAVMQERSLAALHAGPLKKRKLVAVEKGDSLGRIAAAAAAEQIEQRNSAASMRSSPKKKSKLKKQKGWSKGGSRSSGGSGSGNGNGLGMFDAVPVTSNVKFSNTKKFLAGKALAVYNSVWLSLGFVHSSEEERKRKKEKKKKEEEEEGLIPLSTPLVGWRSNDGVHGKEWSDERKCVFCECKGDDDSGAQGYRSVKEEDAGDVASYAPPDSGGLLGGRNYCAPVSAENSAMRLLPRAGRLVPVDFTMPGCWAHTSCALWTSEVFEDEFGKLYSVQKAKGRTNMIKCAYCGVFGAGLGCCAKECKDAFHFKCAYAVGGNYCTNKSFFCPRHRNEGRTLQQLDPQNIVEVMRCITVAKMSDPKQKGNSWSKGVNYDDLMINYEGSITRIGALVLHSLGEIVIDSDAFHDASHIYPRGFTSTRIFWSASRPRQRTMYILRIAESEGRALFVIRSSDDQSLSIRATSAEDAYQQLLALVKKVNGKYFSRPYEKFSPLPVWRNGQIFAEGELKGEFRAVARKEENRVRKQRLGQGIRGVEEPVVAYGLNGPHFFGFGLNVVRKTLEKMDNAKYLAVPLTRESIRYRFVYVAPVQEDITSVQRARAVVAAENELVNLTGCARSEGMAAFNKSSGSGRITRALLENEQSASAKDRESLGDGGGEEGGGGRRGARASRRATEAKEGIDYSRQYFELKSEVLEDRLCPLRSHIHGWGLFTKIDIEQNGMIVEYCGEMIRNCVTDRREAEYEGRGIGSCYMFRLDRQHVIDATLNGSMARFMNHCCVPNAYAKTIEVLPPDGKKVNKIVIFAKTDIKAGEEIVYDYQFAVEDGSLKCTCGHPQCIGSMN